MSAFGNNSQKRQPDFTYSVARNGLAVYEETIAMELTSAAGIPFTQGDSPSWAPNTVLMSVSVIGTDKACNQVMLKLHYEGRDTGFITEEVSQDLTLEFNSSMEPIDSHPDFVSEIGGKPGAPLNGAVFNPDGSFNFFQIEDPYNPGELNPFAGIRSYYMPTESLTQHRIDAQWPTTEEIASLGRIITPDSVNPPDLPGDRNWLYIGYRGRNIGGVYVEAERIAVASGPRKWNEVIYAPGNT